MPRSAWIIAALFLLVAGAALVVSERPWDRGAANDAPTRQQAEAIVRALQERDALAGAEIVGDQQHAAEAMGRLLVDLRAVDVSATPEPFQVAWASYLAALGAALDRTRALDTTRPAAELDAEMTEAQRAVDEADRALMREAGRYGVR